MSEIKTTDNTYYTAQEIAEDALIDFQNSLKITGTAYRGYERDMLGPSGGTDRGGVVNVRVPQRYIVGDGEELTTIPDIKEKVIPVQITERKHIAANFTTQDMTLFSKKNFRERFITPMGVQMANEVESIVGRTVSNNVAYHVGTPGTHPSVYKDAAKVSAMMNKLALRNSERWFALSTDDYLELSSAPTLQNAASYGDISRQITREGQIGKLVDLQTFQTVYTGQQTAGVGDNVSTPVGGYVAAGAIKATVTSGNTIVVDGLADGTQAFNQYDKIVIKGVYSVNPIGKQSTGKYIQYTIMNAPALVASGEVTLTVSPEIISDATDAFRNISNTAGIPADAEVLLATGSVVAGSDIAYEAIPYSVNVAYNPEGILFAAPPLADPMGKVIVGKATDEETGISMRLVMDYEPRTDKNIVRLDMIFGLKVLPSRVVGLLGGVPLGI